MGSIPDALTLVRFAWKRNSLKIKKRLVTVAERLFFNESQSFCQEKTLEFERTSVFQRALGPRREIASRDPSLSIHRYPTSFPEFPLIPFRVQSRHVVKPASPSFPANGGPDFASGEVCRLNILAGKSVSLRTQETQSPCSVHPRSMSHYVSPVNRYLLRDAFIPR